MRSDLRPSVIGEIADWWRQRLRLAEQDSQTINTSDIKEVAMKFQCSIEEALRGLCLGEQLYWGGE